MDLKDEPWLLKCKEFLRVCRVISKKSENTTYVSGKIFNTALSSTARVWTGFHFKKFFQSLADFGVDEEEDVEGHGRTTPPITQLPRRNNSENTSTPNLSTKPQQHINPDLNGVTIQAAFFKIIKHIDAQKASSLPTATKEDLASDVTLKPIEEQSTRAMCGLIEEFESLSARFAQVAQRDQIDNVKKTNYHPTTIEQML